MAKAYLTLARRIKSIAPVYESSRIIIINNIKITILSASRTKWHWAHFFRFLKTNTCTFVEKKKTWTREIRKGEEDKMLPGSLCGSISARVYQAWWKPRRIYLSVKWRSVQGAGLQCICIWLLRLQARMLQWEVGLFRRWGETRFIFGSLEHVRRKNI